MSVSFDRDAILARVRQAAMRGVVRGTESVRNEAISLILNTPKTGRMYQRRSVEHQASAPGEAPASDTGRLVNSIRTTYDFEGLAGTVTASTAYAASLEYGTQRMEPRPYMRPALANRRAAIEADIQREVAQVLSRSGR